MNSIQYNNETYIQYCEDPNINHLELQRYLSVELNVDMLDVFHNKNRYVYIFYILKSVKCFLNKPFIIECDQIMFVKEASHGV